MITMRNDTGPSFWSGFLILCCLLTPCSAKEQAFVHLDMDEGLSQMVTRAMVQGPDGYLWIGTLAGLNRFDGARFQVFGLQDGLASDNINSLMFDRQKMLWIGTAEGMNTWDGRVFKTIPALKGRSVSQVTSDEQGRIWCATDHGIYSGFEDNWQRYGQAEGLKVEMSNLVYCSGDSIWAGTHDGLFSFDGTRFQPHPDPWLAHRVILNMMKDRAGRLWVATPTAIRVYGQDGNPQEVFTNETLGGTVNRGLYQDRFGVIWMTTDQGVVFQQNGQLHAFKENGFPLVLVHNFMEDRDGILWFGGSPGVVAYLGRGFTAYSEEDGLGRFGARVLLGEPDGSIWAGTFRKGLARFENERWQTYGLEAGLNHNMVLSIFRDRQENLWVGSRGGLHRFVDDHFVAEPYFSKDQMVLDIGQDSEGRIWAAENNGIYRRELDGSWQEVKVPGHLFTNPNLLVARNGDIWISGAFGLSHWDGHEWRLFGTEDGLMSNQPYYLFEDSRYRIWFGYHSSRGVTVWDGHQFISYSKKEGMSDDSVFFIGEDASQNIWIGTLIGVDRFDGARFRNYGPAEGFLGYETNAGAFIKAEDGSLWFGTMDSVLHYQSQYDVTTDNPPIIRFRDILLGGNTMDPSEKGATNFDNNTLEASLALLSFTARSRTSIRYRIVGYEDDWRILENQHISCPRLPAGDYLLEVQANRYNGPWSETLHYSFQVVPPFYQSLFFQLISGLILLMLVYRLYRSQVHSVQRRARELEAVVQERTGELRSEILEPKKTEEELREAQNELVEKAHQAGMADIAIGVLHNIGNLLSSVTTSASLIRETLEQTRAAGLSQVNSLLQENRGNLAAFFEEDPKERRLLDYLEQLEQILAREKEKSLENAERLLAKVDSIRNYITMHQSYVVAGLFTENLSLEEAVEDAIALQAGSIGRHDIEIHKQYQPVPKVRLQKTKLAHIIVNLFKNAKEAMADLPPEQRRISLEIDQDPQAVFLKVSDTGCGIPPENGSRMFTQGFTTKRHGHGFGLHSCANHMKEMGGDISYSSDGPGRGTTFILRFPLEPDSPLPT